MSSFFFSFSSRFCLGTSFFSFFVSLEESQGSSLSFFPLSFCLGLVFRFFLSSCLLLFHRHGYPLALFHSSRLSLLLLFSSSSCHAVSVSFFVSFEEDERSLPGVFTLFTHSMREFVCRYHRLHRLPLPLSLVSSFLSFFSFVKPLHKQQTEV